VITVLIAVRIAVVLALRTHHWTSSAPLGQLAFVQVLFPIALVVNASATASRLDFFPLVTGYGVPALLLGVPCALSPKIRSVMADRAAVLA
jgi:hypothetical protein